ncbi:uncharacterized protein METZ01_LOCUS398936, partial [marine metagenome]
VDQLNIVSTTSSLLSEILDREFEALEAKNFEDVEELQNAKFSLMQDLQSGWDL